MNRRWPLVILALALPGCVGSNLETGYGRSRTGSINGTSLLADAFRARGDEVRAATRLTDELRGWADVLVRFANRPGPPSKEEAEWYGHWLDGAEGRRLVYVPLDYDATQEYWRKALAQLPKDAPERTRERVREALNAALDWSTRLPEATKEPAPADDWFAVKAGKPVAVCKKLDGPWAVGLDPARVALTRHQTFKIESESVLLSGDGEPIVIDWGRYNHSRVLVVDGGTFLLNLPLVDPSRRPLADRTILWAVADPDPDEPPAVAPRRKRIAFVEGASPLTAAPTPTLFTILNVPPFGKVAGQLFVLGLVACLSLAPRLGRPRPQEPSGADRPVAHPEALGALLARTGQSAQARALLETYRRWRNKPSARGPSAPS